MNCSVARKILYPVPEKCVLSLETAPAMEHLRECPECRNYFEFQTGWAQLLREKVGTEPAPESLQKGVANLVEEGAGPAARRALPRGRSIAAGVLILAGSAALWLAYLTPSRLFFRELCEDHVKYLSAESQVDSAAPPEIESWFRGKTDFNVRVPTFENASPLGGRLCFLRGRKAALVFYRKDGRPVSLFQFEEKGIHLLALHRSEVDGVPVWRTSIKGYSLVAFQHRGVIYALVSDLRDSELLDLAAAARVKAQGYR
jgi:anti-sigma factor RsiW